MQFKDGKKEYEIVFERIRNKGCGSYPVFKMIMAKPVVGEAFFEVTDIRTQQGHTGINVNSYSGTRLYLRDLPGELLIGIRKILQCVQLLAPYFRGFENGNASGMARNV